MHEAGPVGRCLFGLEAEGLFTEQALVGRKHERLVKIQEKEIKCEVYWHCSSQILCGRSKFTVPHNFVLLQ